MIKHLVTLLTTILLGTTIFAQNENDKFTWIDEGNIRNALIIGADAQPFFITYNRVSGRLIR